MKLADLRFFIPGIGLIFMILDHNKTMAELQRSYENAKEDPLIKYCREKNISPITIEELKHRPDAMKIDFIDWCLKEK